MKTLYTYRFVEPPLPADEARRVADFVGRFLKEEYLHSILLGEFSDAAHFIAGLGLADGALAGSCWTGWGEGFPDIGVVGGVATSEAHRRRGVAGTLLRGACERFDAAGGRLLYLGTISPAARRIYERLGFRPVGAREQGPKGEVAVLCRPACGAAMDEGFAPGRKVVARPASWRDMAAVAPLYLRPHPCVLADAATALPSSRVAAPRRCVRIFWDLCKSVEQGGRWSVLQNESGWLVANAIARPEGAARSVPVGLPQGGRGEAEAEGPRDFFVDFLWHPDYSVEAASFVAEWLEEVEAAAGRPCGMFVCEGDDWKMREARKLGFDRVEGSALRRWRDEAGRRTEGGAVEVDGRKVQLVRLRRRIH